MTIKPITVEPAEVHIHADRRLAFQVLTAFGAAAMEPGSRASEVVEDDGDRKLVRFYTPVSILGIKKLFPTLERVTLNEPSEIRFSLVPGNGPIVGGLKLLEDRFSFEDTGGCMILRYESTFAIRWSWPGWLLGKVLFAPIIRSHMRSHLQKVKSLIEDRASRSRAFPRVEECPEP